MNEQDLLTKPVLKRQSATDSFIPCVTHYADTLFGVKLILCLGKHVNSALLTVPAVLQDPLPSYVACAPYRAYIPELPDSIFHRQIMRHMYRETNGKICARGLHSIRMSNDGLKNVYLGCDWAELPMKSCGPCYYHRLTHYICWRRYCIQRGEQYLYYGTEILKRSNFIQTGFETWVIDGEATVAPSWVGGIALSPVKADYFRENELYNLGEEYNVTFEVLTSDITNSYISLGGNCCKNAMKKNEDGDYGRTTMCGSPINICYMCNVDQLVSRFLK